MARANGCDVVGVGWWWAMVLTMAVAVAALASRMLAREASAAPVDRVSVSPVMMAPVVVAVGGAPRGGDSAAELLAWLCALGWVTFNGARPHRWPWWDPHRARVWAAMFTSAMPGVIR